MTDNIYLFCDIDFSDRMSLDKYLDPLLARLPEEKRKLLAPFRIRDSSDEGVESHSMFCRFRKTCTCKKKAYYSPAQFVLSDRRPVQPYTREIADELRHPGCPNPNIMNENTLYRFGLPWDTSRPWNHSRGYRDGFEPIWRHTWDTVTVTEHEHEFGATLWQPIGNDLYEWAHISTFGRRSTGLGRIEWDAEGNARLFRVTEH